MRWDRLTVMTQEAFQAAQAKAEGMGHQEFRPEHLLWIFLGQEENVVGTVLSKIGVGPQKIRQDLETALDRLPKTSGGEVYVGAALRQIMNEAQKEADKLKDEYISTEHVFLAMLKDTGSGAGMTLAENGVGED